MDVRTIWIPGQPDLGLKTQKMHVVTHISDGQQ